MATDEKQWHQRFLKYMEGIVNNPNYKVYLSRKNQTAPMHG